MRYDFWLCERYRPCEKVYSTRPDTVTGLKWVILDIENRLSLGLKIENDVKNTTTLDAAHAPRFLFHHSF